MLTIKHS
jgi:hypothetical protein